jgi:transposase-like protein
MSDGTSCPHCEGNLPDDILRNKKKDCRYKCLLCQRSMVIKKDGDIIPLSDSYGDSVYMAE